jgi:hypothetical protein
VRPSRPGTLLCGSEERDWDNTACVRMKGLVCTCGGLNVVRKVDVCVSLYLGLLYKVV